MSRDPISPERMHELKAMCAGLYGTIVGLTEDPFEAITLISMLHLSLWLNSRAPGHTTEAMLEDYCANFQLNADANEAAGKAKLQ